MYGDQFGEFVCGYWGLHSNNVAMQMHHLNPLSPNTDQCQFSPNHIDTL